MNNHDAPQDLSSALHRPPDAERRAGGTSVDVPAGDRSTSPVHRLVAGSAVGGPPAGRGFARAGSRASRKPARGRPGGPRVPRVPSRSPASCPATPVTVNVRVARTGAHPPGQVTPDRKRTVRLCTRTARDHPRLLPVSAALAQSATLPPRVGPARPPRLADRHRRHPPVGIGNRPAAAVPRRVPAQATASADDLGGARSTAPRAWEYQTPPSPGHPGHAARSATHEQ